MNLKLCYSVLFVVAASSTMQVERYEAIRYQEGYVGHPNQLLPSRPSKIWVYKDAQVIVIDTAAFDILDKWKYAQGKPKSFYYHCVSRRHQRCTISFEKTDSTDHDYELLIEWKKGDNKPCDSIALYELIKH